MTSSPMSADAYKDMLRGDISPLCWLKGRAEVAGRGTLDNMDARAVLRAIRQAENAAYRRGLEDGKDRISHWLEIVGYKDAAQAVKSLPAKPSETEGAA